LPKLFSISTKVVQRSLAVIKFVECVTSVAYIMKNCSLNQTNAIKIFKLTEFGNLPQILRTFVSLLLKIILYYIYLKLGITVDITSVIFSR